MKIAKGQKNGLNYFVELESYFHNVKAKWIQINYEEFCETPDSTRCFENACKPLLIQDTEESTSYTDYCNQFEADKIENTINDYLKQI